MWALDFEYDGKYLSDYNFIICRIGSSSSTETISAGSEITFHTVPLHSGRRHSLCSTSYDECLKTSLTICKNPCLFEDISISDRECRELMRWLNRREFLKFQLINPDESSYCYFNASFNIHKIVDGDVLCGLELSVITDAPFGYGEEIVHTIKNASEHNMATVHDYSDEIGFTHAIVTVNCHTAGTLKLDISNGVVNTKTVVKNCSAGETIVFDSELMIVTSSDDNHKVYDDFNFEFPKLSNTIDSRVNMVYAQLFCDIEIKYRPIIKGTL